MSKAWMVASIVMSAAWIALLVSSIDVQIFPASASAAPVECYTEADMRWLERLVLASQREYLEAGR